MLLPGLAASIEGEAIDCPGNAITLSRSLRVHFGQLEIFFSPFYSSPFGPEPHTHTYIIAAAKPFMPFGLPYTRGLLRTPGVEAPLPELLALHRACCLILKASDDGVGYEKRAWREGGWGTAGDYINKVLRERDVPYAAPDGSTELGNLVRLRLLEQSVE